MQRFSRLRAASRKKIEKDVIKIYRKYLKAKMESESKRQLRNLALLLKFFTGFFKELFHNHDKDGQKRARLSQNQKRMRVESGERTDLKMFFALNFFIPLSFVCFTRKVVLHFEFEKFLNT